MTAAGKVCVRSAWQVELRGCQPGMLCAPDQLSLAPRPIFPNCSLCGLQVPVSCPSPASTLPRPGPGIASPLLSHLLADACQLSPARVSTALTVAASDITDTRWASSNYGSCVDLYSPGVNILSSMDTSNTATITATGTSMATPIVSGVAALYLQDNPSASAAEVRPAPWLGPGGCSLQGPPWQPADLYAWLRICAQACAMLCHGTRLLVLCKLACSCRSCSCRSCSMLCFGAHRTKHTLCVLLRDLPLLPRIALYSTAQHQEHAADPPGASLPAPL